MNRITVEKFKELVDAHKVSPYGLCTNWYDKNGNYIICWDNYDPPKDAVYAEYQNLRPALECNTGR